MNMMIVMIDSSNDIQRKIMKQLREDEQIYMIIAIPMDLMKEHEEQAKANHGGQTLERLNQRGGVNIYEAYAILTDDGFTNALNKLRRESNTQFVYAIANRKVDEIINNWLSKRVDKLNANND